MGGWKAAPIGGERSEYLVGSYQILFVTSEPGEADEVVGRHRVAGGDGAVIDLLLTDQQLLVVGGCEEEATALLRQYVEKHFG